MKTIIISLLELIELSEGSNIELHCEICKRNTSHKPIKQVGTGTAIDMAHTEEGGKIEIEDVEDACRAMRRVRKQRYRKTWAVTNSTSFLFITGPLDRQSCTDHTCSDLAFPIKW